MSELKTAEEIQKITATVIRREGFIDLKDLRDRGTPKIIALVIHQVSVAYALQVAEAVRDECIDIVFDSKSDYEARKSILAINLTKFIK